MNSVSVSFAALDGGALGQTTGTSITLDDNAAGHNWFIDTTPWDNSEFLPTSNPNEWVAKQGTAAYGKMDMLSVLLHEFGHALGIEHSADSHNYMGTTLTPGVRRMPTAEELALMQQLVGEVKAELTADTSGSNGPSQLPLLPLGGFGLAFLGRLRPTRYGSLGIEPDYSTITTQFQAIANAQFMNGGFVASNGLPPDNGWNKQGQVDIANGVATLQEVTGSQTRLNQVFMLKPTDRYLSFTLSGSALDDPSTTLRTGINGGPDDAFEVALLDANTGVSLLSGTGLTHSDAFLNLQADGTESLASQVTKVVNTDGSITYRVDLSSISNALKDSGSAGQAVNLSFDLIGFAQTTSHINVSDVRVSGLPELHDVAASLNEDSTLAFDPFAQVDNAALLQLGSHVVDQPAHGTVTVNPDGTFAYTPAQDYFGTDTFTYRLNDGPPSTGSGQGYMESNLATVTVSIAAVNDAPVASDVYATLNEDTPLTFSLGDHLIDVDSAVLTPVIVTGPQHGTLTLNADGSYTYIPDANYNGTDSFTWQGNDGELDSNIASFNFTIASVNDAPVANDTVVYSLEDNPLIIDLRANASDVDSLTLTPVIVTQPVHGTLSQNADASYTYTPDANYNGADSFTYQVNDAQSSILNPRSSVLWYRHCEPHCGGGE